VFKGKQITKNTIIRSVAAGFGRHGMPPPVSNDTQSYSILFAELRRGRDETKGVFIATQLNSTQLNSTDPVEQHTAKSVVLLFMTSRPTN